MSEISGIVANDTEIGALQKLLLDAKNLNTIAKADSDPSNTCQNKITYRLNKSSTYYLI